MVTNTKTANSNRIELPDSKNGDVEFLKISPDSDFAFVGIPSASSVGVFKVEKDLLTLLPLKWITIDFQMIEMDDQCSQVVTTNFKSKVIEVYSVKWEFDLSSID